MGRKKKDKVEEKEVITTRTPRKRNPVSREMIESSEDEEEDPEICPVCSEKNDPTNPGDKKNRMIGCDSCDKWYHWSCVGIDHENKPGKDDDWYCRKCTV
ncbi:PHD finger protein ALFIN-LIKE 5, partial [Eurytemora carolleeae]|uniref:PHD finger protein ALFIN-LIKE 5 n=1 Tax=Eurytemora carolleeae TaxID=1294199 RepID=UPI000C7838D8